MTLQDLPNEVLCLIAQELDWRSYMNLIAINKNIRNVLLENSKLYAPRGYIHDTVENINKLPFTDYSSIKLRFKNLENLELLVDKKVTYLDIFELDCRDKIEEVEFICKNYRDLIEIKLPYSVNFRKSIEFNFQNIRQINFNNHSLTDEIIKKLTDSCKNITDIFILSKRVTDLTLQYIGEAYPNLQKIGFYGSNIESTRIGFMNFLQKCRKITRLYIWVPLEDFDVKWIFENLSELKNFDIRSNLIGDDCLLHIDQCKNLNTVVLRNSNVTNTGIKYLDKCRDLKVFRIIQTDRTKHLDISEGIEHILSKCKNLESLMIYNYKVDIYHTKMLKSLIINSKYMMKDYKLIEHKPSVQISNISEVKDQSNNNKLYLTAVIIGISSYILYKYFFK